jgi:hypothetical protein
MEAFDAVVAMGIPAELFVLVRLESPFLRSAKIICPRLGKSNLVIELPKPRFRQLTIKAEQF